MTQEEKSLLLQDLCARLPYGVMIKDTYSGHYGRLVEIGNTFAYFISKLNSNTLDAQLYYIKPYLRPKSSMTEDEWEEFLDLIICVDKGKAVVEEDKIDVYNKFIYSHHIDNKNFIESGLALKALEGMYEMHNINSKWTPIRSSLKENEDGQIVGGLKFE